MQIHTQLVIRFLMAEVRRARQQGSGIMDGGLLVSVSANDVESSPDKLNCTDVLKRLPSSVTLSFPADPEELSVFSETWGPLNFLLSVQVGAERQAVSSDFIRTERFLHRLSLVFALVEINFTLKVNDTVSQKVFSGRADSRFVLESRHIRTRSDLYVQHPLSVGPGPQCGRLHPVPGGSVPLLLPPDVVETGLCGDPSLLPLATLAPCVEQYPNRPACITEIHILLYGPSNVPLLWDREEGPSGFSGLLSGLLAREEFGLSGVRLAERPFREGPLQSEVVYTADSTADSEQSRTTDQTLILFLFIQHSDPFHSQLCDYTASEEALEQHLDQILLHNEDCLLSALHSVLQSTLNPALKRRKGQGKIQSSLPVILSSLSTVVTSSSCLEFRTACLNRMKVRDTHELIISLRESLQKVTEGRLLHSRKCDNRKCLSSSPGSEDFSGNGETDEQEWTCAELSNPEEELVAEGLQGAASQVSGAGKRQWPEELDSDPPPVKLQATRSPWQSESLHCPSVPSAQHHGQWNQQEDMLWLQEISNMSDWE